MSNKGVVSVLPIAVPSVSTRTGRKITYR